jgi:Mg2+ and Co2+ transporter CorA
MEKQDKIKKLQENLAKDLVNLEDNELVTEQQLDKITDAYAQVYDIISKAVDNNPK